VRPDREEKRKSEAAAIVRVQALQPREFVWSQSIESRAALFAR
jgi:hypothetical protein